MSRENVEIILKGIDALNQRDFDTLSEFTDEQAEWHPSLTAGGALERSVYRGRDAMRQYLNDLDDLFADTHFEVDHLDSVDAHRVFFRGRVTARARASGIPLDVPIWALWEVRDGKVVRGTAYLREEEALEAVGVPE